MVDITYGFGPLDTSGISDIYQSSSLPMHGFSEAQQRALMLEKIRRMKRAQMLMNASGLRVPDYTSNLQSMVAGIKPEKTRAQAEYAQQMKTLGTAIRQHKPRTRLQVENLVTALKLNPDLIDEAYAMIKPYRYADPKEFYGTTDGDISVLKGSPDDPRVQEQLASGDYGSQFLYGQRQEVAKRKETSSAIQALEKANPQNQDDWKQFWIDYGRKYASGEWGGEAEWNPYDTSIRDALNSVWTGIVKPGEDYYLHYLEKDKKTGQFIHKRKLVTKGGKEEKRLLKEHDAGPLDQLGLGKDMPAQWQQIAEEAIEGGANLNAQVGIWKRLQKDRGLWTADPTKQLEDFLKQASEPEKQFIALAQARGALEDWRRKNLTETQIEAYWPRVEEALSQPIPTTETGAPIDINAYIRGLVDESFPPGQLTDGARAELRKRIKTEIEFRQANVRFGEERISFALSMTKEQAALRKLLLETDIENAKWVSIQQAGRVNQIIAEAADQYVQLGGEMFEGDSLLTNIEQKFRVGGIVLMPDHYDKIRDDIRAFEKEYKEGRLKDIQIGKTETEAQTADIELREKKAEEATGFGVITPGYRYDQDGNIYMEDGEPVPIRTIEGANKAAAAGYDREAPRSYIDVSSHYVTYRLPEDATTEMKKNFSKYSGQPVLSMVGMTEKAEQLSTALLQMPFMKDVSRIEDRYNATKHALEQGSQYGGEYDHAAILNFMRTMDDSIVTESEIETVRQHSGFTDRMRNIAATWETGASLNPTQRGMIADIMEQIMSGLRKTKLSDVDSVLNNWVDNFYGPTKQPLFPINKYMIAPWYERWDNREVDVINVPNKPGASQAGAAEVIPDYKKTIVLPDPLQDKVITPTNVTVTDPSGEQVETFQPKVEAEDHVPAKRGELPRLPFFDDIKRWESKGIDVLGILESGAQGAGSVRDKAKFRRAIELYKAGKY